MMSYRPLATREKGRLVAWSSGGSLRRPDGRVGPGGDDFMQVSTTRSPCEDQRGPVSTWPRDDTHGGMHGPQHHSPLAGPVFVGFISHKSTKNIVGPLFDQAQCYITTGRRKKKPCTDPAR
jgi:hypothetical protein